jgi:hypothetical protein
MPSEWRKILHRLYFIYLLGQSDLNGIIQSSQGSILVKDWILLYLSLFQDQIFSRST